MSIASIAINTIIAIIAIMIDNICYGSDNGLAIIPGRDDHTRERLTLTILTLAASGHQGFLSLASPGMHYLAAGYPVRYCKPV